MLELTGSKYQLPYNKFISVKVQAYNFKGWGQLSDVNIIGPSAEVFPQTVSTPYNGNLTTETQIDVVWSPLTTAD